MKKLVIMPGGFHPFHAGHKALYDAAVAAFPRADVFVAATADTSTRPVPFKMKKQLAQAAGIPANRFIQVKSPFRAEEITQMYDPNETQLIFVRSEKDADSQPRPGGIKRDGTPAYLQPYKRTGLLPMNQHGYMVYLPVATFSGMTSATEIRSKWPTMEPEQKSKLVNVLYPGTAGRPGAADKVIQMLDTVLTEAENFQEATLINDPESGLQLQPDGGMGTWDESSLVSNLARKFTEMLTMIKSGSYQDLYRVLYRNGATENMVRALAELAAFRDKQGRRPVARGREIDITDYIEEK